MEGEPRINEQPDQAEKSKQEKTIIKIVCGWCGKEMGTKEGIAIPGGLDTSHGICSGCEKKVMDEPEE